MSFCSYNFLALLPASAIPSFFPPHLSVFLCHRRSASACVSPLADCEAGNVHLRAFFNYHYYYDYYYHRPLFGSETWLFKVTKDSVTKYEMKVLQPSGGVPQENV